jgi:hypothetical protein
MITGTGTQLSVNTWKYMAGNDDTFELHYHLFNAMSVPVYKYVNQHRFNGVCH